MFSGLHWPDLLIVVVLGLLVFGPKRLPELGSSVGKTIKDPEVHARSEHARRASYTGAAGQPGAAASRRQRAHDHRDHDGASTPAEMVSEVKAE